ncbi:MAG: hypothetical protein K8S94_03090 [Planctomycetia bacterium]|nr:hypothetical protein [Planctomycetia bacterium]
MNDHEWALALKQEAYRERPEFSPALHARILASVTDGTAPMVPIQPRRRFTAWMPAAIAAAAVLVGFGVSSTVQWPADVATNSVQPDEQELMIERIPTLSEIGESLLAETSSLAADAAGLPRWNDLVEAGGWSVPAPQSP